MDRPTSRLRCPNDFSVWTAREFFFFFWESRILLLVKGQVRILDLGN